MPSKIVQAPNGEHEDEFLSEKFLETGKPQQEEDEGNDVLCGIGSWRPACLQRLRRPAVFTFIYCITMMMLGMPNAYFYAVTSTIEKVFNINSRITGIILIGNDISQVLFGLLIGYIGSKSSRPLWMSFGMFLCSATCFIYAFNHRLWDGVQGRGGVEQQSSKTNETSYHLCMTSTNGTKSSNKECLEEDNFVNLISLPAALFFFGQFVAGLGNLAITALGFSYSDDFSKKKNTPMNISFILSTRVFGSLTGYMVAAVCLRIYIVPNVHPDLTPQDPRWLGAWWLGFVLFGILMAIVGCVVILLPRKLPSRYYQKGPTSEKSAEVEQSLDDAMKMTLKDMLQTVSRLLKNKACFYLILSESVTVLYMGASQIYSSRYTEVQFGQSASRSSLLIGIFSLCSMIAAVLVGAMCLKKFKPRATRLVGISCFMRLAQVVLIFGQMYLSCGKVDYTNVSIDSNKFSVESSCSIACECPTIFQPVCVENKTFLSPCLAGCDSYITNKTKTTFAGCSCVSNSNSSVHSQNDELPMAESGICPSKKTCHSLKVFLMLTSVINILTASLFPSQGVILLRCVDKRDKSMAMALKTVLFCLIGFLPGPILYGSVFDSCCLLHEAKQCGGGGGNCWVYDLDLLRYRYLGTSALVVSTSFIFCLLVYFEIRRRNLSLFQEEEKEEKVSKNDANELQIKKIFAD